MRRLLEETPWYVQVGGVVVILAGAGIVYAAAGYETTRSCGSGFTREGTRCRARGPECPRPLLMTPSGCDVGAHDVVEIPETTVLIGPSDWEAEGRVAPRTIHVNAFAIDRLEVTGGLLCRMKRTGCNDDPARAATDVSLEQARAYCGERGGRLPTEDEWLAAAAGDKPRRYPWGDTGAVCRRAAWGIATGPCDHGAVGPDTVGAHPDGATPLGVHDLAGNVAEWVEADVPVVRGGSWMTTLATELRTWPRTEVSPEVAKGGSHTIGFRCAYSTVR